MSFQEKFGMSPLIVLTTVLGVFMAILDSEVVNVAIPKMTSVFTTTQSTISWVDDLLPGSPGDRRGDAHASQHGNLI